MKVALAIDGSKVSMRAVEFFIQHLSLMSMAPHMVHIVLVTVNSPIATANEQYANEEGMRKLNPAGARLRLFGYTYRTVILTSKSPAKAICQFVKDDKIHLICMGTRGMSAVGKVILGSTATEVLRYTSVPVLLTR